MALVEAAGEGIVKLALPVSLIVGAYLGITMLLSKITIAPPVERQKTEEQYLAPFNEYLESLKLEELVAPESNPQPEPKPTISVPGGLPKKIKNDGNKGLCEKGELNIASLLTKYDLDSTNQKGGLVNFILPTTIIGETLGSGGTKEWHDLYNLDGPLIDARGNQYGVLLFTPPPIGKSPSYLLNRERADFLLLRAFIDNHLLDSCYLVFDRADVPFWPIQPEESDPSYNGKRYGIITLKTDYNLGSSDFGVQDAEIQSLSPTLKASLRDLVSGLNAFVGYAMTAENVLPGNVGLLPLGPDWLPGYTQAGIKGNKVYLIDTGLVHGDSTDKELFILEGFGLPWLRELLGMDDLNSYLPDNRLVTYQNILDLEFQAKVNQGLLSPLPPRKLEDQYV